MFSRQRQKPFRSEQNSEITWRRGKTGLALISLQISRLGFCQHIKDDKKSSLYS